MAKAPEVQLERSGGQVRLRGLKYPLPVSLDTEKKGRMRVTIQPNKWTSVPDEIYQFLQNRFEKARYTSIPDVDASEANPQKPGVAPVMTTEEVDPQFFLEFRG